MQHSLSMRACISVAGERSMVFFQARLIIELDCNSKYWGKMVFVS